MLSFSKSEGLLVFYITRYLVFLTITTNKGIIPITILVAKPKSFIIMLFSVALNLHYGRVLSLKMSAAGAL